MVPCCACAMRCRRCAALFSFWNAALLEVDVYQQREERAQHGGRADGGHLRRRRTSVARSNRSLASAASPRARWKAASVRTASGCCSNPFKQLPSLFQAALPDPQIG